MSFRLKLMFLFWEQLPHFVFCCLIVILFGFTPIFWEYSFMSGVILWRSKFLSVCLIIFRCLGFWVFISIFLSEKLIFGVFAVVFSIWKGLPKIRKPC